MSDIGQEARLIGWRSMSRERQKEQTGISKRVGSYSSPRSKLLRAYLIL